MDSTPTKPEFWNVRYDGGRTPWDLGRSPAALERFLAARAGNGARVLIPGCGSGYEVMAFARAGYAVTAIDFSAPAVARARANVGPTLAEAVVEGDFFTYDFGPAPFDVVYERTFICALPPEQWPQIAARYAALLRPGGQLAGVFFFGEKDDGPPFGFDPAEADALFGAAFELIEDQPIPAAESLPLFAGRERWQIRRRRTGG